MWSGPLSVSSVTESTSPARGTQDGDCSHLRESQGRLPVASGPWLLQAEGSLQALKKLGSCLTGSRGRGCHSLRPRNSFPFGKNGV